MRAYDWPVGVPRRLAKSGLVVGHVPVTGRLGMNGSGRLVMVRFILNVVPYCDRIDSKALMVLVIFDRTPACREKSREKRISYKVVGGDSGRAVMVFGG